MGAYFDDKDLAHFGDLKEHAPELWEMFEKYYGSAFQPGLLTKREKVLIGFAVAQSSQCPYCIDAYTEACLEKGSDPEQMTEAVHVSTAIRGGASLVHGLQMLEHATKASM